MLIKYNGSISGMVVQQAIAIRTSSCLYQFASNVAADLQSAAVDRLFGDVVTVMYDVTVFVLANLEECSRRHGVASRRLLIIIINRHNYCLELKY